MKIIRLYKGESLFTFPDDYTVVDIETSGLYPSSSEIIEISALKYRNDALTDSFVSFLKPKIPVDPFITDLTGISNEMLSSAPDPRDVLPKFYDFVGDDILIGHNVNFDVNFLYDNLLSYNELYLKNSFVDVLRLSRKALPFLPNHRQMTIAEYYGIQTSGSHRAQKDCEICQENYLHIKKALTEKQ